MRFITILLVLILAAGASAQQSENVDAEAAKVCAAVDNIPIPAVVPRSEDEKKRLSGCDSEDLYDNLQFEAARRCALYGWNGVSHPESTPHEDPDMATLVAIYANGDGVPRNVGLAVHILCQEVPSSAPQNEMNPLIVEIAKSESAASPPRFDLCDIGFGLDKSEDYGCAQNHYANLQAQRLNHLKQLASEWTAQQKAAFSTVLKAHDEYAEDSQDAEAVTGTGVGYSMLEAKDDVNKEFADDIDRFEQGKLPAFTHRDYLDADRTLNASYKKLLAYMTENQNAVCAPPQSGRKAERAWLFYRDAFVAFAQQRWPRISPDSWLTFLARERTNRMDRFAVD